MTIRCELRFWLVLLLLTVGALEAGSIYLVEKRESYQQATEKIQTVIHLQKFAIEEWMTGNTANVHNVANLPVVRGIDRDRMEEAFQQFLKTHPDFSDVFYVEKQGYLQYSDSSKQPVYVGDREYFREAVKGNDYVSDVLLDRTSGQEVVAISSPVMDSAHQFNGLIVATIHLRKLNQFMNAIELSQLGETFIINKQGRMLTQPRLSINQGMKLSLEPYQNATPKVALHYTNYRGENVLGSIETVHDGEWYIVGEIEDAEIHNSTTKIEKLIGLNLMILLVIGSLLSITVSRRIEHPISQMVGMAKQLRRGRFDSKINEDLLKHSPREIKLLCETFNEMGTALQNHIGLLQESEERYRTLIDLSPELITVLVNGKMVYMNAMGLQMMGAFEVEELEHKDICSFFEETYRTTACEMLLNIHANQEPCYLDAQFYRLNGQLIDVELFATYTTFQNQPAILIMLRDITVRKQTERELLRSQNQVKSVLETVEAVIWSFELPNQKMYISSGTEKIYGVPPSAFHEDHQLWFSMIHAEDQERIIQSHECHSFGKATDDEYRIIRADGEQRWVHTRITPSLDSRGNLIRRDAIITDITERKSRENQIEYMAYTDSLTTLPNRYMLTKQVEEYLRYGSQDPIAVLFIDLDRFKNVNDSLGHRFGDLLLKEVANRFEKLLPSSGQLYRQGGDEFLVIVHQAVQEEVEHFAITLLEHMVDPFYVQDHELILNASVGISYYPLHGKDLDTLIRHADTAMYKSKAKGGNTYQVFSPDLEKIAYHQLEIEKGLRKGLENNEFYLVYQPKIDTKTRRLVGMEALVRWDHPQLGLIPPAEFIPIAEETGLIIPLGEWVLREAVRQTKEWHEEGFGNLKVAVNISARQFTQSNLVHLVELLLHEYQLKPQFLELELTESILQDFKESIIMLNRLRCMGVSLAIDDFGTGYSSLSYLRQFPIQALKIDRSFISDIDQNENAIVDMIISMAHSLDVQVVAEGVENEHQLAYLQMKNCQFVQGYYTGKPFSSEEFGIRLRQETNLQLS